MSHSIKHYDIKGEGVTHIRSFPKHAIILSFDENRDAFSCSKFSIEVLVDENDETVSADFVIVGRRHDLEGMISLAADNGRLVHVGSIQLEDEYEMRYVQHLFYIKEE